jgi:hypothetical protein
MSFKIRKDKIYDNLIVLKSLNVPKYKSLKKVTKRNPGNIVYIIQEDVYYGFSNNRRPIPLNSNVQSIDRNSSGIIDILYDISVINVASILPQGNTDGIMKIIINESSSISVDVSGSFYENGVDYSTININEGSSITVLWLFAISKWVIITESAGVTKT